MRFAQILSTRTLYFVFNEIDFGEITYEHVNKLESAVHLRRFLTICGAFVQVLSQSFTEDIPLFDQHTHECI